MTGLPSLPPPSDIDAMPNSPTIHKWWIAYSNGGIKVTVGYAEAPDEDTAIEQAIEKFNIDSRLVGKLIAKRTKAHPPQRRWVRTWALGSSGK